MLDINWSQNIYLSLTQYEVWSVQTMFLFFECKFIFNIIFSFTLHDATDEYALYDNVMWVVSNMFFFSMKSLLSVINHILFLAFSIVFSCCQSEQTCNPFLTFLHVFPIMFLLKVECPDRTLLL